MKAPLGSKNQIELIVVPHPSLKRPSMRSEGRGGPTRPASVDHMCCIMVSVSLQVLLVKAS